MNQEPGAESVITVDEVYTYDIGIDRLTTTVCVEQQGTVRVRIPYDGLALQHTPTQQIPIALGEISIGSTETAIRHNISVSLPADALVERVKRGEQYHWSGTYAPDIPNDPLIAVDGQVFDGADFDPEQRSEQLYSLLFGTTDTFVNDLRLQLNLWVPNLFEQEFLGSQDQELRAMLIEQESNTQVLLPDLGDSELLARHMAALAQNGGGRILFGVRANGEVRGLTSGELGDPLIKHVLAAALRCTPAVPFFAPEVFIDAQKSVVRIAIASSRTRHAVNNSFYRREAGMTVPDGQAPAVTAPSQDRAGVNLADVLASGNAHDVVMIDAQNTSPERLDLGSYISGLINAGSGGGLLVIRNLPAAGQRSRGSTGLPLLQRLTGRGSGTFDQLQERLQREIDSLTPRLRRLRAEFTTLEGEQIAVIRIDEPLPAVALYADNGYLWSGGTLRVLSATEVLERYLQHVGTGEVRGSTGSAVALAYGELQWPVQPPTQLKVRSTTDSHTLTPNQYHVQRNAIVWEPTYFAPRAGTNGLQCQLVTRLRQAFVPVAGGQSDGKLNGQIRICFEDALASGFTVDVAPASSGQGTLDAAAGLFSRSRIERRTTLILNMQIAADWLFQQRRRMSLLHFRLPDITLAQERYERMADLRQACADLGFWVYDTALATDDELQPYVILKGVRSTKFRDIHLLMGIRYEANQIDRELRYTQRTDIKKVQSGRLDTRILLWSAATIAGRSPQARPPGNGTGQDEANPERTMTRLQLDLRELLEQRLHYLRSE